MTSGTLPAPAVLVRRARRGDATALFDLSAPFFADGSLRRRYARSFAANHSQFLVAQHGSSLLGCTALQQFGLDGVTQYVLYNLCVHAAWQGRGIGSLLLDAAVDAVADAGVGELFAASVSADSWFAQRGFAPVEPSAAPRNWVGQLDPTRASVIYCRSIPGRRS